MKARVDHVVLWVEDQERSLAFFEQVVGFEGVRVEAFRAGKALFPSVRLCEDAILDLMPKRVAPMVDAKVASLALRAAGSAGHPLNHVCFAVDKADLEALRARLAEHGQDTSVTMTDWFGARGQAPLAFYFHDPDGNVFEARYYD